MTDRIDTEPEGIPRPTRVPRGPQTELPPLDPSPGVRLAGVVREGVTDLGGLGLLGYLATHGHVPGTWAVAAMLALLLPAPVLMRLAKVLEARYGRGTGAAVALVAAAGTYASIKQGAVLVAGAATLVGACS